MCSPNVLEIKDLHERTALSVGGQKQSRWCHMQRLRLTRGNCLGRQLDTKTPRWLFNTVFIQKHVQESHHLLLTSTAIRPSLPLFLQSLFVLNNNLRAVWRCLMGSCGHVSSVFSSKVVPGLAWNHSQLFLYRLPKLWLQHRKTVATTLCSAQSKEPIMSGAGETFKVTQCLGFVEALVQKECHWNALHCPYQRSELVHFITGELK